MEIKDYYKILELEPSASLQDIKKAYRRLAQRYHPDKNQNDQYALIHFTEIKEAFEVLTNPSRKNNYLQQRWWRQSLGKRKFRDQPITPPEILKQLLELDKYISTLDTFRMNKYSLYEQLRDILSQDNIARLKEFGEQDINHEMTGTVLRMLKLMGQPQAEELAQSLRVLCEGDPVTIHEIDSFIRLYKRKNRWEKYKSLLVILITITISLLIYFMSR